MNAQSGRSMVEMLGVLAIVGVLSIAGISGYSKAMRSFKTNKTIDLINTLVINIENLYFTDNSPFKFGEVNNAKMIEYGIIEATTTGSVIKNPFNGDLVLSNTEANNSFSIKIDKIPQTACVELATLPWTTHAGDGLYTMSVNSKKYGWSGENLFPISVTKAMEDCVNAENELIWEFQ